jgi:hypothetical protein
MPSPRKPLTRQEKQKLKADLAAACDRAREVGRQLVAEGLLPGRIEGDEIIIDGAGLVLPPPAPKKRRRKPA